MSKESQNVFLNAEFNKASNTDNQPTYILKELGNLYQHHFKRQITFSR